MRFADVTEVRDVGLDLASLSWEFVFIKALLSFIFGSFNRSSNVFFGWVRCCLA